MRSKNIVLVMCIIIIAAVIFTGCSSEYTKSDAQPQEDTFSITGLDGDITLTLSEIKALEPFEGRVEGADSEGNPVEHDIKGGRFLDLLEQNGYAQSDFAGIRIIATDGYSIEVSQDILKARDIIIGYEMDGQPLDERNAPFRVFIPDERAMYWVRMVNEINVIGTVQSDSVTGIYMMETLYREQDFEDYEFIGQTYQTLDTHTILSDYPGTKGDVVLLTAADGLEKNETVENFYKGVINMTGENSPEFFSNTLPGGMFVKNLKLFKYGGNEFVFMSKVAELQNKVTLDTLLLECNMEAADEYTLHLGDGSERIVKADALASWIIGIQDRHVFVSSEDEQLMDIVFIN